LSVLRDAIRWEGVGHHCQGLETPEESLGLTARITISPPFPVHSSLSCTISIC
jgi:hypothetical protein